MSRLRERYEKEVAAALNKEFGYKNVMAIPRIQKVVVNMGLGEATQNAKIADTGADEIARITGQKPVITPRRRSRSRSSSCARACRSAPWSRCVASACGSSWIA